MHKEYTLPEYPCEADMWDVLAAERRPIVVYGMGNGADKLLSRFEKYNLTVADFFASDGFVRGHSFHGKRVKSFSEIKATYPDFVVVVSFASSLPEVIERITEISAEYDTYVPDMPVAGDEYFDRELYNANYEKIVRASEALADARSRSLFAAIVTYKLSGRIEPLLDSATAKQEGYALVNRKEVHSYVDLGAYNGDTLREAVENFPTLERAILFEPDRKNLARLERRCADILDSLDVRTYNAAAWSADGEGSFSTSGNRNSSVDSTRSFEHREDTVRLLAVDSVVDTPVDYMKYDVEGAEYEALLGSERTIDLYTPTLLVSLYHRSRDIFFLINYLSDKYGDRYDLVLHRLYCLPAWEINLFLLPKT